MEIWRRNLYTIWFSMLLLIMGFSFTFPILPLFFKELGVTDSGKAAFWTGLSGGAMGAGMLIFGPIWGMVGDRYGRKKNAIRAAMGGMLATGLTGLATDVSHVLILRFLYGAGTGMMATSSALVAATTPKEKVGYAMGVLVSAPFIGTTLGPLAGGILVDTVGFRAAFFVGAGVQAVAGLMYLLLVKEKFEPPPEAQRSVGNYLGNLFGLAASRAMFSALMLIFMVQLAPTLILPVLPLFISELQANTGATISGAVFSLMGLAGAVSSYLTGRISARVGPRTILFACATMAGLLYIPMAAATSVYQVMVLIPLAGLFKGPIQATTSAIIARSAPPDRLGSAFGLMQSANSLAGGIGPVMGGSIADAISLRAVFLVNGLGFLVVAALTTVLVKAEGKAPAPQPEAVPRS
ncbi:MAG: MFS transporter [Chloroflexi bacterium]|nr:MFS transporter [Chloroflexota bacterium]